MLAPNNEYPSINYLFERYGRYLAAPESYNGIDALLRAADHLNMLETSDYDRWNTTPLSFTGEELAYTAKVIQGFLREKWPTAEVFSQQT